MSIPRVMRAFRRGNSFGTGSCTLDRAEDFKAKRHRLRVIPNPYTSKILIQRENLDPLEEVWTGKEERKGNEDVKRWYTNGTKGYVESVETLSHGMKRKWTIKSLDTDSDLKRAGIAWKTCGFYTGNHVIR
jgi:hypothetical protein